MPSRRVVTSRPSVATTAYACGPRGARVAAICRRRVRFVCGAPSNVDREAREPQLTVRSNRADACALGNRGSDPLRRSTRVGPWTSSRSAWDLGRDLLRHDALDPGQPAVPDERDLDDPRRGRRRIPRWRRFSLAGCSRRLEIDREQAREREHENDERDAHSGRSGFAAPGERPSRW